MNSSARLFVPLFAAIIGLLMYVLSNNGKASEIGRIAFAWGLLLTLAELSSVALTLH